MPQPFAASAIAKGWPAGNVNPWCGPLPRLAEPAASRGLRTAAGRGAGAIAVREGAGRPPNAFERLYRARAQARARSGLGLKAAQPCRTAAASRSAAAEAPQSGSPEAAHSATASLQSADTSPLLDLRRQRAARPIRHHSSKRHGSARRRVTHSQQSTGRRHCKQSDSHSALLPGHACALGTGRPRIWGGGSRAT
jgi:hypothetical protein